MSDVREAEEWVNHACDSRQYDSDILEWIQEGDAASPARKYFWQALRQALPSLQGKHVLDVGCGTGHLSLFCQELGATSYLGIEPAKSNLQIAERTYPGIRIQHAAIETAVVDRPVDVVIALMVFEHIRDVSTAFKHIHSWLVPDGRLILVVGDKEYFSLQRSGYDVSTKEVSGEEVVVQTVRPYGTMYDMLRPCSWYVAMAARAGFFVESVTSLTPTEELMQEEPRFRPFANRTIHWLLVLRRGREPVLAKGS